MIKTACWKVQQLLLALLYLPAVPAQAAAVLTADIDLACSQTGSMLACSYRLLADSSAATLTAESADRPLDISTRKTYPSIDSSTAVLFLVDTSDPGRQEVIDRNAVQIARMLGKAGSHHRFGLANFDKELIVDVPVGGATDAIIAAARALKAVGMTTELYRNTLRAIETLGHVNADRKVIYLMSDGQAEDKAYFHDDVIRAARKYGVVINSFGYPRSVPLSVALQTLRRLSDETGGIYIETGTDFQLPEAFLQTPYTNVDRGGQFVIDLGPLARIRPASPLVTLRFETATTNIQVPIPIAPESLPELQPPVIAPPVIAKTTSAGVPAKRTPPDTILWYGVPVVLVLLSLLTLSALVLLYRKWSISSSPIPVIPIPNHPLACLIRQDEPTKSFPITTATCRIGRSRDNEMTIDDNSVSRRHAEIRRTFDGRFVLYDRNSTNGVYVNDRKISHHKLDDGDIIEIGDVLLCFTQRPADFNIGNDTAILKTRAPLQIT